MKGSTMLAFAVPLAAEKRGPWESWLNELKGPRKAAFDDMNARLGLTRHEAYLQPAPDGNFLVIVVQDGPGGESFGEKLLLSDNEFDRWFAAAVADLHGIDPAGPPPPAPTRYL
jgi:hypothetical protein